MPSKTQDELRFEPKAFGLDGEMLHMSISADLRLDKNITEVPERGFKPVTFSVGRVQFSRLLVFPTRLS